MGPRRPTLPTADFWNPPTSSPPQQQVNNENYNPIITNGHSKKVDANANEILPPKYPVSKNHVF
jgi:hypothetical protein